MIYTRVSFDRYGDMLAVDRQRDDCLSIAKRRGWQIVGEYSDNSVSASKRDVSRPEYTRMVEDYEAGIFEAIIVWDLDRLTRQPRQLEDWIDRATDRGLSLVTANGEADLSTDAGRLFARIKAAVSREEIERKGARQKRANRQRAEGGGQTSWKPCLGYTSRNEVIDAEAALVRLMFDRVAAGESIYGITAWLNEKSTIKPKQSKSGQWSRTSVRGILTNPRYAARVVHQGEVLPTSGKWEAIVSDGVFDQVAAILADPRRKLNKGQTARKHLLSNIAKCGVCGKGVRGQGYAYVCPDRCQSKAIEYVDRIVLGVVAGRLAEIGDIPLNTGADPELDKLAADLRGRLTAIEADYDAGFIDGRRFAVATEKVQAELEEVERQRRGRVGSAALASVLNVKDPVEAFNNAPLGVRRTVVEALLSVRLMAREKGHPSGVFDPETVKIEVKG